MSQFDYVVVGSGSGGSVVARRLVDAGATVALLEAGARDDNPAIHDPGRWPELPYSNEDWAWQTDPQEACYGRRLYWPRGKVLAGTSTMNGMAYIRGHPLDYDGWAYHGCPGWGWEDVLPLFKRSEDCDRGESEWRGAGGPLHVASVELMREVGHQPALAKWSSGEVYPGPDVRTREEIRDYVRNTVGSYHHQVGTCKMGQDPDAVVDPELRVYGVEGLRVADASVMPFITTGNTNAPTFMVGEKASDLLLAAQGKQVVTGAAVA